MKKALTSLLLLPLLLGTVFGLFFPLSASSETARSLRPGSVYSLMNCDTGRIFAPEGIADWILEPADEENGFFFRDPDSNRYLAESDGAFLLSEQGEPFTLTPLPYHRFSLSKGDLFIRDSDEGASNLASLSAAAESGFLSTCWFLTEEGGTTPLRIMPLGDSLTLGLDADTPFRELSGYRARLSVLLAEQYPDLRFVFVGSQVHGGTGSAEGAELYRHEGHSGYTVTTPEGTSLQIGLYELCPFWLQKYQPDVVLLMIGTNDIGRSLSLGEEAADRTAELHLQLLNRIRELSPVKLILLETSPPVLGEESFNRIMRRYNRLITENGQTLSDSGVEILISDIYSLISGLGADAFCSDSMHMSRLGYDAIAGQNASVLFQSAYLGKTLLDIRGENLPDPDEDASGGDSASTDDLSKQEPGFPEDRQSSNLWLALGLALFFPAVSCGFFALFRRHKNR